MVRFYFHIQMREKILPDLDGIELPDIATATDEALLTLREMLADAIRTGNKNMPDRLIITDSVGRELAVVSLADALPKALRPR